MGHVETTPNGASLNDRVYYAIGDVHGENDRLAKLHDFIFADAEHIGVKPFFVHLGEYIDRGPDSRGVIERVMKLAEHADVVALKGNHEEMLLKAVDSNDPDRLEHWLMNGGEQTLQSYVRLTDKFDELTDLIDRTHVHWMRSLPTLWRDETRRFAFVHGGIDPHTFPNCEDKLRLWTRSNNFFDTSRWPEREELNGLLVVHGHTPTDDDRPEVVDRRINVDTGAVYGGRLTSVVLAPREKPRFLSS